MRTARALMVVLISVVGLATLFVPPESSAAASPSQDALHEVLPGDDLRLIAGYYYGDTRQWERIWKANRDQVRNPNRVERGTILRIPGATSPAESYADFVARARRPLPPVPSKAQVPAAGPAAPAPSPAATGTLSRKTPAAPAAPGVTAQAPAPAKAPAPTPVTPAVPAPPQKAATPAAPPAPQPVKPPEPQTGPAKPPAPPVRPVTQPPPPQPEAWYEEWGLVDLFTSTAFLGIAGVVVVGLAALLVIRRRRSSASAVEEVPE